MPTKEDLTVPVAKATTGTTVIDNIDSALESFRAKAERLGAIADWRTIPARSARTAPFPDWIDARLEATYRQRGVTNLYTHQDEAARIIRAGKNLAIVTPTASGKTLCYNLPILNEILSGNSTEKEKSGIRALYLFPTKALAQDQLAELYEIIKALDEPIRTYTYDGDTPRDARKAIRARASIVVTNPDMLHTGILPHHTKWQALFENLRYVVLDELHTYRGVFGSHVCNVLRRLRRIARFYGSNPQFICCSATIANAREFAEALLETEVEIIDESGAPQGEKHFVLYNPPVVNKFLGIRRSYINESARVASHFLEQGCHTIVFANSRLRTELLVGELRRKEDLAPGQSSEIRGYRGGYLPGERREIERGLRTGAIKGVVATNALELGIDIGSLDVAVMAGYPGTIASTWQRAGRAGRRSTASAAILVGSSAPLDQFIAHNPDYFYGRSPEHAYINPDNLEILISHLKCAAFELPLDAKEKFGAPDLGALCAFLAERGFLHQSGEGTDNQRWHWTHESYPANTVSLRKVTSDNFLVVDESGGAPRVIGEVDFTSALTTLHEKAIYLHGGKQFQVERLDYKGRKAYVRQVEVNYYTDAIDHTQVRVLDAFESAGAPSIPYPSHGEVDVRTQVVGFKKLKFHTNENVGAGKLELPEQEIHTTAYWLTFPRGFLDALPYNAQDRKNGLQALRMAMKSIAGLLLMCDPRDLRSSVTENTVGEATTSAFEPNLYLYDNFPGGIGFSQPLFTLHDELINKTLQLIESCACGAGCPSCVGPAGEAGENGKEVARAMLHRMVNAKEKVEVQAQVTVQ